MKLDLMEFILEIISLNLPNNSVMCGYFCIGFIGFMLTSKTLIEFTSLFSPYDFEKNDDIIYNFGLFLKNVFVS